jgi:large subunit ribosomal protein L4
MPTAKLLAHTGEARGEMSLPESVFGIPPNRHVMWEAARNFLANQRLGTSSVRTRADVRGGGRKPWRQKGTGRARSGTIRSPLWRHGGRAFGPRPRDYGYVLPKATRRLALRSALSQKADSGLVTVVADFTIPEAKTREVARILTNLGVGLERCLLVIPQHDAALAQATRNLPRLQTREYRLLNTYEVLHADRLLILESAVPKLEEVWGHEA